MHCNVARKCERHIWNRARNPLDRNLSAVLLKSVARMSVTIWPGFHPTTTMKNRANVKLMYSTFTWNRVFGIQQQQKPLMIVTSNYWINWQATCWVQTKWLMMLNSMSMRNSLAVHIISAFHTQKWYEGLWYHRVQFRNGSTEFMDHAWIYFMPRFWCFANAYGFFDWELVIVMDMNHSPFGSKNGEISAFV